MLHKWKGTVGIELTYQPGWATHDDIEDDYDETPGSINYCVDNDGPALRRQMGRKLGGTRRAYSHISEDPGCVEVATRILTGWADAKKVVSKITKVAEEEKWVPKLPFCTGGGGQIHLGVSEQPEGQMLKAAMCRDHQNRPYLGWLFNDPEDNSNANSWTGLKTWNGGRPCDVEEAHWTHKWDWVVKALEQGFKMTCYDKDHMLCCQEHTIEFRYFDMPTSWEQHEEHLSFAMAYRDWIEKKLLAGEKFEISVKTEGHLDAWRKPAKIRVAFKQLIAELGLPWARYAKYLKNVKYRYELENYKRYMR